MNDWATLKKAIGMVHLNLGGRFLLLGFIALHGYIGYTLPLMLLSLVGIYGMVLRYIHLCMYKENFCAGGRYERGASDCPSNSSIPKFERAIEERTREMLPERRQSLKDMPAAQLPQNEVLTPAARQHKKRSEPRLTVRIDDDDMHQRLASREGKLDVDHVDITWAEFLLSYIMLIPGVLWVQKGLLVMKSRKWLYDHGFLEMLPVDFNILAAKIVLENAGPVIHFVGFKDAEKTIAVFAWNEFTYVVGADEIVTADLFTVDVDVSSEPKRMVKAMLDDRKVTAKEVVTLIMFNTVSQHHVKVHSLANWGINTQSENPYIRHMSVNTVMYNYFGNIVYVQMCKLWQYFGILNHDYVFVKEVFQHACDEGIQPHQNIRELVRHSELVKFVVGLRNVFLNEFGDYRSDFMGIDGEAMFVGTILHSLDHQMYVECAQDCLWLDHNNSEFGFMAEMVQNSSCGFSDDIPIPFNRKYKNAPHPFYQTVYQAAHQMNPKFADDMDTCIIK